MKTKQNNTLAVVLILAASMALSSCKKEQALSPIKAKTNLTGATDVYNEMFKATMTLGRTGSFKTEDADAIPGAIITDDTLSNPHTRTIDYGTGCMDSDGKVYKGQMVLYYTSGDFFHDAGSYITVIPNNYSVNGNDITGRSTFQNMGINGNGNISFDYTIDAKRVWANNGGTDSVGGLQTVEWVAGSGTSEKIDDQFSFTGSMGGVSHDGNLNFATAILQPLIQYRVACNEFYVKGETVVQVTGHSDIYTDYGDGTCDNLAVETIDGQSTTITLE